MEEGKNSTHAKLSRVGFTTEALHKKAIIIFSGGGGQKGKEHEGSKNAPSPRTKAPRGGKIL